MNALGEPLRVLIAEDNTDHMFLTMRALRSIEGTRMDIEGVRDGEEALAYLYRRGRFADRRLPHLIFLDIRMPRMDGLEVLRRIKEDPQLAIIPVVILTASQREEDVAEAYTRGTNSYVTKPSSVDRLQCVAHYWTRECALPAV